MATATPVIFRCKCQTGRVMVTGTAADPEFFHVTRNNCLRCWTCGARFRFVAVTTVRRTAHVCDARCEASKGPTCECSCGGKNHGGAYSLEG